jgi:hypothetical protein
VWDLWLDCASQREIAEQIGVALGTANDWIVQKTASADFRTEPESRQHFDIWQFQTSDKDSGQQSLFRSEAAAKIAAERCGRARVGPNTPDVVRFAETLERVCIDTVEGGEMTRDLAILIRPDHPWLTTNQFLGKLDTNLKKAMA